MAYGSPTKRIRKMKDLMTPIEKAREARHQQICAEFINMREQHPDAKPNRLISMIAQRIGMTVPGITNVLKARGLYTVKERR